MNVIDFQNVSVGVDAHGQITPNAERLTSYLLEPLDLNLSEHRIGVIGANGSGKSSFVRLINGLIVPTTGTVRVNGHDSVKSQQQVRQQVGFVFQNPEHQIVYPIVAEDIEFGLHNQGLDKAQISARREAIMSDFALTDIAHQTTYTLSGGQKQMVALAGVVVMQPKIILLDEPTTLLDLRNRNRVRSTLAGLSQQLIIVTHHFDEIADFDRVLCFEAGELVDDGPPASVISAYEQRMQRHSGAW